MSGLTECCRYCGGLVGDIAGTHLCENHPLGLTPREQVAMRRICNALWLLEPDNPWGQGQTPEYLENEYNTIAKEWAVFTQGV